MVAFMSPTANTSGPELPASAYPYYQQIFASDNTAAPSGLLFDSKHFAVMAIAQPAKSQTPDVVADKEGDRIMICMEGDLALQIGDNRFRLGPGDAVQIPRGVRFGKSSSSAGARMLLIRGKGLRSFSIYG